MVHVQVKCIIMLTNVADVHRKQGGKDSTIMSPESLMNHIIIISTYIDFNAAYVWV